MFKLPLNFHVFTDIKNETWGNHDIFQRKKKNEKVYSKPAESTHTHSFSV